MLPTEPPPVPISATDNGAAADSAPAAPPRRELRNSLWCVDKAGKVGMIAEINGGVALFFHADRDGKLAEKPVSIPIEELTQAPRAQLPEIGLTNEQLTEAGYQ